MMFKCSPIADAEGRRYVLTSDVSMECADEAMLKSGIGVVALILLPLTVLIPAYYAGILYYYRQKSFTDKEHPEGIVTVENIKPEGETLGERLSELDDPHMKAVLGFFYKSYERPFFYFEGIGR